MYMSCWPTCSSCGNLLSFPLLKTSWDIRTRLEFCILTRKLFRYSTGAFEGQGAGQYGERLPDENLPSWVPHWEIVYRATLAPWDVDDRFSAAKGFSLRLQDGIDSDSLVVEGIIVGVVGYGLDYMWHDVDISSLRLQAMGAFFKTEPGLRLLARTLTAGKNWYGSLVDHGDEALADFSAYLLELSKRKPQERNTNTFDQNYYLSNYSEWDIKGTLESDPSIEAILEKLAAAGDAARFLETAIPVCERRRMFLTMNGFLGIGPDCVQEGDIVCVLSGGDLPFILRPVQPKSEPHNEPEITALHSEQSSAKHYRLVGECYVEGLMNGEAISALDKAEDLVGPVPPYLVVQDIVTQANTPEPFQETDFKTIGELGRLRRKKEKLEQGRLAKAGDFEHVTRVHVEKKWFDIR